MFLSLNPWMVILPKSTYLVTDIKYNDLTPLNMNEVYRDLLRFCMNIVLR